MLGNMLASESRMVTQVAVCAVQLRILGGLAINFEDLRNPLHIDILLFTRNLC